MNLLRILNAGLRRAARWLCCWRCRSRCSAAEQRTFATPEAAVDALHAALKANDDAALVAIFGDKHKNLVDHAPIPADDTAQARRSRGLACTRYRLLEEQRPDRRVLLIGDQAWPFPIPLVREGERWRFATERGAEEILNRRIGRNERNAMDVLHGVLDAQQEYASRDRDGDGVLQYAQQARQHARASSTACTGRPMPAKGEEASPFGPLIARERGLPRRPQGGRSVPRLSLPHPHAPGQERGRRRLQLHHQRPHDRRLRDGRVSRLSTARAA